MVIYAEYQLIKIKFRNKLAKSDPLFQWIRIIYVLIYGLLVDVFCFAIMLIGRIVTGENYSYNDIREHNIKDFKLHSKK